MSAPRLWHNGRVFTGRRYAEAILIDGGHIVSVGGDAQVRREAPTGTESVDLAGRLVIPGLIDSHLHLSRVALARESFDAGAARTRRELVDQARRWAEGHPIGPVVGMGWSAGQFEGDTVPRRRDLDEAVGDRPFVIHHASGHAAVLNSEALRIAGIDRGTPDPPGGRVGRGPDGEPDGTLYESALRRLDALFRPDAHIDPAALARTLESVAAMGLTTVASMNAGLGEMTALRELRDRGLLRMRVRLYGHLSLLPDLTASRLDDYADPDLLSMTGIKGFTDGAFGPRTAWLSQPYADAPTESGLSAANDAELSEAVRAATAIGLAPALHAIGDRAVGRALKLLHESAGSTPAPIRVEHAALTPPELLPHLGEVGPALVVQPGFVWSDHWLRERLGPERARWAYAFRTLIDRGLLLAGSSDAPYDPVDPWRGLAAAVRRRDPAGRSANPETAEALPIEGAVQLYTVNGGRVLGDATLGILEPGARADLVFLDSTGLEEAVRRGTAGVQATWVGGAPVAGRAVPMPANG